VDQATFADSLLHRLEEGVLQKRTGKHEARPAAVLVDEGSKCIDRQVRVLVRRQPADDEDVRCPVVVQADARQVRLDLQKAWRLVKWCQHPKALARMRLGHFTAI